MHLYSYAAQQLKCKKEKRRQERSVVVYSVSHMHMVASVECMKYTKLPSGGKLVTRMAFIYYWDWLEYWNFKCIFWAIFSVLLMKIRVLQKDAENMLIFCKDQDKPWYKSSLKIQGILQVLIKKIIVWLECVHTLRLDFAELRSSVVPELVVWWSSCHWWHQSCCNGRKWLGLQSLVNS